MKKKLPAYKNAVSFTVFSTALLFFSFAFNGFGTLPKDFFLYNYKDSESLVVNQVVCGGDAYSGQLLERIGGFKGLVNTCDIVTLTGYSSQFGLQGKVYVTAYKIYNSVSKQGIEIFISLAQIGTALLSALVLALFGFWVWKNIDRKSALVVIFLIAISPMLVGFSRNLYWVMPMLFLPLVDVLFTFEYAMENKKRMIIFSLGLFVILCARYLMGYEYITTITIMILAASSYYIFMKKEALIKYLWYFSILFGVSIVAFMVSLFIHIFSLNSQTGSYKESAKIVYSRAFERSINSDEYYNYAYDGMKNMENEVYVISNSYIKFDKLKDKNSHFIATVYSLISYAILPVMNVPISINQPFNIFVQSLSLFIILLLIIYIKKAKLFKPRMHRQIDALYLSILLGFLGYLSWLVIAHSHSLVHLHINGITMYMPMVLFGYIILSLSLVNIFNKYFINKK